MKPIDAELTATSLIDIVFEEPGTGRCLVAPGGTVLRANDEWRRSIGSSLDDVIGVDVIDLLPGTRELSRALLDRARAGHRVEVPRHLQRIEGRETWWEGSIAPVGMAGGTGLLVTMREARGAPAARGGDPGGDPGGEGPPGAARRVGRRGAEEALRDSEQRFRLLAEAMPQIVCMIAPDGTVEYVNATWIAFSGLDLAATECAGWEGVVHPDDLDTVRECLRRCLKALQPQDVEVRYRAADGTWRWFLSRLAPVVEGDRVIRLVGAAMDMDDRKRAEEALRQSEARARAMGETLREADRRKDEFLGMLSHELRNPLAPIRNSIYILRHADPAGEQAQRARDVIERQTEHLTRLVDDLLDVTRIARGKVALRRSRADLRELALRAADDFRSVLRDRGVSFELDACRERLWSEVDPTRITQVVGNLLHNASKFTRAGDTVTLRLAAVDGGAELRVRDTGAGIEPALLPHVFDAFVQGERTLARTEGGLGLGLALVKGIVELHGGSVRVESAGSGEGAEFIVRLPLTPAAAYAPAGAVPLLPRAARRVLVVDDNVDAAESLAEVVRMLGHAVEVAYDGPGAIAKANAAAPDVVLCDLGLPGMSGYDVARALRARMAGVELFAVSGYAQPDDVKAAIEAGFDGHVAKPASMADIERLLATS